MVLANRLAPQVIPILSREYAGQLEFAGDFQQALEHFNKAIMGDEGDNITDQRILDHNLLCKSGIARNSIRCGNVRKGVDIALQLENNHALHLECAQICESSKLYSDAALMYEKGGNFLKAAELYLKVKNTNRAGNIMEKLKVEDKEILKQYAVAREEEGKYREAVKAYFRSGDQLNTVRILLEKLNNPGEAVKMVKESRSVEGAKMVARYFQRMNDMTSAIEFLVLSNCNEEAFRLASSTGQMDVYADILLQSRNTNSEVIFCFYGNYRSFETTRKNKTAF